MKIDIKTNIKEVAKDLSRDQKRQIPFATSLAINNTLEALAGKGKKVGILGIQMRSKLDRPTPFTQKGFYVIRATKKNLMGILRVKDVVEKYLSYQIDGGVRSSSKKIAIPTTNKKLNSYGNIAGKRSGVVKGKNEKILTIGGMTGVYKTHKGKVVDLLIAFKDKAVYTSKFPIYRIADGYINKNFNKHFKKAIDIALKSAK